MKRSGKRIAAASAALALVLLLLQCLAVFAAAPEYTEFSELSGKKAAMLTGAPFEELVKAKVPDIGEIQYFSSAADMQLALKSGKIDAYLMNNAVGELLANRDEAIEVFPQSLGDTAFGYAFAKGSTERAAWQAAYDTISEETKAELWAKWTGSDDSIKTIPAQDWPGANGTVNVASCDTLEPMSYIGEDGELIGFDIEIALLMAKEMDVHLNFIGMEFSSVMPSVESGKALFGNGSIVVNDERKEVVDFIEYYPASFILMVRSAAPEAEKASFWEETKASFYRTFVTDARYQMILSGLAATVVIAVASGILGTLLGFGLVFVRRRNISICNKLIDAYNSLIIGIPVVVILMVLYYIIFGSLNASSVAVAIVGFTFIFGSRAFGLIWNAVQAVDKGQMEAALALGYSERKAFRRVILPQSKQIYLPTLKTQFIMLLKETSVAGYITVLDLTRAGDLIRSRTMEAFFPLLAIALIYFVLTRLFTFLIETVLKQLDARKQDGQIKGVD